MAPMKAIKTDITERFTILQPVHLTWKMMVKGFPVKGLMDSI